MILFTLLTPTFVGIGSIIPIKSFEVMFWAGICVTFQGLAAGGCRNEQRMAALYSLIYECYSIAIVAIFSICIMLNGSFLFLY